MTLVMIGTGVPENVIPMTRGALWHLRGALWHLRDTRRARTLTPVEQAHRRARLVGRLRARSHR